MSHRLEKKCIWISPSIEVLKFVSTNGTNKRWQGPSVEGSGEFIHESVGGFHRAKGKPSVVTDTKTALDSSSGYYLRKSFGPS